MKQLTSIAVLLTLAAGTHADSYRTAHGTLDAFVGVWRMDLSADEATFGERGGDGTGTLVCEWSTMQAWVDCELDSFYDGLGRYALKMVLYRTADDSVTGAFVTNSFGGGRLYSGRWVSETKLVYLDAWIEAKNKWQYQRTTYTFGENDELSFVIEVSNDGLDYLPHSRGTYHRQ